MLNQTHKCTQDNPKNKITCKYIEHMGLAGMAFALLGRFEGMYILPYLPFTSFLTAKRMQFQIFSFRRDCKVKAPANSCPSWLIFN